MRIGLIGVGHWHAAMHASAAMSADAEITAVWDPDPAVASVFSASRGLRHLPTVDAVLDAADLVVVMGRPSTAPALAEAAIVARKPMVLEKPAAISAHTVDRLAAMAASLEGFVAVPLPNRLGPIFEEYQDLLAAGRIGELAHANFRMINGPPQRYRDDGVGWMLDPAISGGGSLRNLGIHGVDSALSLATGKVRLVSAHITNRLHHELVEDYAHLVLEDEAGAVFTVEAGYTFASMQPGGDFEWRIASANAYFVDAGDVASVATLDDGARRELQPLLPTTRYDRFMSHTLEALRVGAPPTVGLDDYARAMRLIDDAYGMQDK